MISWVENIAVQQALALIRHLLTTMAGALVAKGLMTNDQATTITGGVVTFVIVLWSLIQKKHVAEAVDAMRTALQPSATVTNIASAQAVRDPSKDSQGIY